MRLQMQVQMQLQLQMQLRRQLQRQRLDGERITFPTIAMRLRWMGHPMAWGWVGFYEQVNGGLVGEGDVDGVAFDDAVACGWGLGDDRADGGDGVGDGFGEGRGGGAG